MHHTTHFHQKGQRPHQEDAFYIDPEHRFYVVCDGVGGTTHGALASKTVVDSIKQQIDRLGMPHKFQEAEKLLSAVWDEFIATYRSNPEADGMGTTLVAAFVLNDGVLITHVGDSRAYHIRPGQGLLWRTKDHSEVQELYDAGIIPSIEAMEDHPRRNVITRAFIARENANMPEMDYHIIQNLRRGDILMLCTDGVLEPFSQDSQVDIIANPRITLEKKTEIIRERCAKVSKDNNTAMFVEAIN